MYSRPDELLEWRCSKGDNLGTRLAAVGAVLAFETLGLGGDVTLKLTHDERVVLLADTTQEL